VSDGFLGKIVNATPKRNKENKAPSIAKLSKSITGKSDKAWDTVAARTRFAFLVSSLTIMTIFLTFNLWQRGLVVE
jgi:hypothetical protein